MNVKDIIREKRLALGMTMKEVADKVGVSEATISRWESGEIANMRRGAIFSLAKALNISPNEIMGWETTDTPSQSTPTQLGGVYMLEIYKRIRARREELGISQEELAKRMGYKSRSSINKIEKGENDIPQSKIVAFAQALRTTPEALMGWETSDTSPQSNTPSDPASILLDDEEIRTLARNGLENLPPEQQEKKKAQFKKIMSVVFDEDDDE